MASSTPTNIGTFIVSDPEFRHGRPCIAGTGMSVHAVAQRYLQGQTAEDIAADIPDIPPSHIYAAVAYYLANRAQIDGELARENDEADRIYEHWKRNKETEPQTSR
jgi:uncharacterized protein (DUF433 family)